MEYITVQDFVKAVMDRIPKPWGADIVDQVFLTIENDPEFMSAYEEMLQSHGQYMVENSIGLNVLGLTGMKNTDRAKPARSKLIQNYTELE